MNEDRDLRQSPKNLWDYVTQTKETARVCRWVWQELISLEARQRSKWMVIVFAITVTFSLCSPYAVQYIFNGLLSKNLMMVYLGFGGYLTLLICGRFTEYVQARSREIVITNAIGDIDQRITKMFLEKSKGQHQRESSTLNPATIEKGRANARGIIEMLLFNGIDISLRLLVSFILVLIISPVAGLIMGIVAIIHILWSLYLNKRVVEDFTPIEREWRRLNRYRTERWEKAERVKNEGKEGEELQGMQAWTSTIVGRDVKFWLWYCLIINVRYAKAVSGLVLVMAYGAWLVWTGEWMIGMLYPLFMWGMILADNLWHLGRIEHQLNWNIPAVRLMMEALTIKPDIVCLPDAPRICHKHPICVRFDNVSYTYPRGSQEDGLGSTKSSLHVIKDVSFEIRAGEKVALIGPSGAGKTTIMRLLLRYMDPDQGCIHVNGYKLHELDLPSWMHAVGYIPQNAQVLDGSIRYNLMYGLPKELRDNVTDDQLWELMRLLQIDFGERLTDGLETVVGRNGMKLSGGQAQRLMVGAAAMKRPLFMIIDEATSSLDSTTEKLVQKGLAQVLSGNVSGLVIAHRLSTVRYLCDRFVVLRDSSLLQSGDAQVEATATSFEELYRVSPTFRQLANDQDLVITG